MKCNLSVYFVGRRNQTQSQEKEESFTSGGRQWLTDGKVSDCPRPGRVVGGVTRRSHSQPHAQGGTMFTVMSFI